MLKTASLAAVLVFAGCSGAPKGPAGSPGAGSAASTPGSGSDVAASGSGSGSGSDDAGSSGDDTSGPFTGELPAADETATGTGWSIRVGFHDSPTLFDPTPDSFETLTYEIRDAADKPAFRVEGWDAIAGKGVAKPAECEELKVTAVAQTWGELSGARISVVCSNGEDIKDIAETAILLDIRGPAKAKVSTLWAGVADLFSSEMEACTHTTDVTFSVKGTTMTRTIAEETAREKGAPKACKKKKAKRTEDVAITRAP